MEFPTNLSFRINNKQEYDEFVRGLQSQIDSSSDSNATAFAMIVSRAKHHNDKGTVTDMPEAYVEVGGKRISSGDMTSMANLFSQEIVGHKASVILYERDGLAYKAVRTRRGLGR